MSFQARLMTSLYERDAGMEMAKRLCSLAEEMGLAAPMLAGLAMLRKEAAETGKHEELEELQAQSAQWQGPDRRQKTVLRDIMN